MIDRGGSSVPSGRLHDELPCTAPNEPQLTGLDIGQYEPGHIRREKSLSLARGTRMIANQLISAGSLAAGERFAATLTVRADQPYFSHYQHRSCSA
jgi:hypothetical protein